jgi:hypothetical protein
LTGSGPFLRPPDPRLSGVRHPRLSTFIGVSKHSTARRCFSFVAQHLAIGDEAHIRDRLLGAQRRPSADFPATGLMTSALQNPLDTHVQDRSPERVAPVPSARQQRVFMRALGCGGEELVARVGAETAIKRVETELRRAKRARSRKLYALWSVVLVRIETRPASGGTRSPLEAPSLWPRRVITRGCKIKGHAMFLVGTNTNRIPPLPPPTVPRRGVSFLLGI